MCALVLTSGGALACVTPPLGMQAVVPDTGGHDAWLTDRVIGYFTNLARCRNGLDPFGTDPTLTEAARIHTDNMAALDVFSHDTTAPGAETMQDRIALAGVQYRRAAENTINGFFMQYVGGASYYAEDAALCRFTDAATDKPLARHTYATMGEPLVARWMASPGHRRNIPTPDLTRQGATMARTSETALCGGMVATQVFAG